MSPSPVRILLVDDHAVVRAGLRALIESEPGLDVIGEAADGQDAVGLATALRPDVVLMDVRLAGDGGADHGIDGVEATRRLIAAVPGANVVMLTSSGTRDDVVRAMKAGARGYILKAGSPDDLFRAVRTAAAGGVGLGPEAASRLVGQVTNPAPTLSHREVEVVRLLAEGLSNRDIAASLFLTEATVKTHLVRIYRKLDADNRAGAVSEAVRRGLVDLN
jgi:DNA-binding NarL/FixJ family response regulator